MKFEFTTKLLATIMILLLFGAVQADTDISDSSLESFVQDFFSEHMAESHTPGSVFVLTSKDGPVFMRGFGKFHFESGGSVDPEKHLFRIASITKNFTAVAIMQLVEKGLIDLDADVNQYLKHIQLADRFDAPVTVRNLLQHTSGIEEQFVALSLRSAEDRIPMTEYFQQHPPIRAYPPGQFTRYTNRAYMLLGHIVEDVSGEVYEDYMRRHITDPLGMFDTVFDPSEEQASRLSPGVFYDDGQFIPSQAVTTVSRPSGDYISSAHDMSRYIQMYLNLGELEGTRILSSEYVQQMISSCFTHHPEIEGACFGMRDFSTPNGFMVRSHGGYYGGWNADFVLFPEQGLGYFAATNGDAHFQRDLLAQIVEPLFGISGKPEDYLEFAETVDRRQDIEGLYRSQFVSRTFEKVIHLFTGDTKAEVRDDGTLVFGGQTYRQLKPLVFRDIESGHQLVFVENEDGVVNQALANPTWRAVYDKLSYWQTAEFQIRVLIVCLTGAGLSFFVMLGSIGLRSRRDDRLARFGITERFVVVQMMIALLLWIACWAILWLSGIRDIQVIMFGVPPALKITIALVHVAAFISFVAFVSVVALIFAAAEQMRHRSVAVRNFGYLLATSFCVGLSLWSWYWRII